MVKTEGHMPLNIADIHPFHQLIISLILGLLVGLQRQWAESPLAGIRTFSLIALLGTTCALLAELYGGWVIALGFLGTITAMIVGHISKKNRTTPQEHSGLVTEFAMLLMFTSGVLVRVGPIWLAATLAGILAVILQAKIELHSLASRFIEKEIKAIMQFVLVSLVIFPIVPNQTYGPFDVLNPHNIWLMVVFIVAISLAGYIIYNFFGERAGLLLGGILGGVISSTATTMTYSRRSKELVKSVPQNALLILIAWTVLYVRVFFEIMVAAPQFKDAFVPIGIMFLVSILSTIWLWRRADKSHKGMPQQNNPTELSTALTFGLLYSGVLLATAFSKQYFGSNGLTVVAILSGVTDVDAITLSTAQLVETGKLLPSEGWPVIIAAIMSNIFFKGVLAGTLGGRLLFKTIFISWTSTLVTGFVLLWVW